MAESPNTLSHVKPAEFSRRRRVSFRALSLLLSLLFLALLEGILRIAGLGGYPPIIRPIGPTEHGTLVITDPAGAGSYFFANRQRPGYNEQYSFYHPKPPGTLRIVLVGESAMKGFPEPRNLAASAFLGEMLRDAWPGRNVEVINLGTTAVASYPVLEIMTESLSYTPDLVIVHTGHNEFFGTYGVASIGRAGSSPWMLRATRLVHSLALVQALERILPSREPQENKTLMQVMMGRNYLAPDDWRRRSAAANLEHNVAAMVERCKAKGIPIIVCNQPSNERCLAPLGTNRMDRLDLKARNEFERSIASATAALPLTPTNAIEPLIAALTIWPDHATAHYLLGQALLAAGRHSDALEHFIRARDLDTMPWRAPTMSQQAILRAARQNGAILCDLESAFRKASPGGAIGWELMDDHVHPTLEGEALWARTLCECLTRFEGPLHLSPEAFARLATTQEYARRLGDNPYDRYGVAHTMRVIFNIPFMRETNPQAFARFDALANSIENNYSSDVREALHEWQTATPHAGGKRPITGMVARVLMREGKYAEALELLRIAQKSVPDYTSWHMEYVYFALACQERLHGSLSTEDKTVALDEIKQGRFLMEHGHSDFGLAERYLGRLHQLRGEFAEAIPFLLASRQKLNGTDLVAADQALVVSSLKTGDREKATQVVQNGIAHSASYSGLYQKMLAEVAAYNATNSAPDATSPDRSR